MSPKLKASRGGGRIEEDRDERTGTEAGSGAFTSFEGTVEFDAGGGADGGELSAGEAVVEALPGARGKGIGAWERGAGIEPGEAAEFTAGRGGFAAGEGGGRGSVPGGKGQGDWCMGPRGGYRTGRSRRVYGGEC